MNEVQAKIYVGKYPSSLDDRVTGGLTCVLRPDPVTGEAAWTEEVRQANNRRSEQPKTRRGISRMRRVLLLEP